MVKANHALSNSALNVLSWLNKYSLTSPYGHLYYRQFVWSQKCQKSYIPYLYTTNTSVKGTLGSVLLVSVLKRFDCIGFNSFLLSRKVDIPYLLLQRFTQLDQNPCFNLNFDDAYLTDFSPG